MARLRKQRSPLLPMLARSISDVIDGEQRDYTPIEKKLMRALANETGLVKENPPRPSRGRRRR